MSEFIKKNIFVDFVKSESFGGIFLFVSAVWAMIYANSFLAPYYFELWHTRLGIVFGKTFMGFSVHHWIDDVLMAFFFLLVGLEIKREVMYGELCGFQKAAFPVIAALGGMLAPGIIYYSLNAGTNSAHGFGIPMATDIAFALGVILLLGKRVPPALKVFLVTLAVADDLGAIVVIAIFYTSNLKLVWLVGSGLIFLALLVLNRLGVKSLWPYLLLGVGLWFTTLNSGIHATIAAVALAFTIPIKISQPSKVLQAFLRALEHFKDCFKNPATKPLEQDQRDALYNLQNATMSLQSPLERLEHILHPYGAYFIMPLFALANAGVQIGKDLNFHVDEILWGVILGLVVGKPIGILGITFLSEKLHIAKRPDGVSWGQILGAGMLAGIGFTMSMFISNIAFNSTDAMEVSKIAILLGSITSGIIGTLYLLALGAFQKAKN
ncbi:Sodium:Proton antiporter NhaA [Helicobacter ailurogastricus]|uniref:sodium/proton antiporter NhaA n=1 Tax=Helicobacter ailurogastricus TaxID=1578720 RepID=UPI000CF0A7D7|nr:sodium/proton antiporter NhaA [Helicobacter ailurogastricus]GMB89686.1 Sodium:Proton antiporter NhaA [Helicobacter ailurogastricus]